MRFTTWLMLAAGAAILTGCAPPVSIHPLYTSQDLVADPALEGTWAEPNGEIWQIHKSGDGYEVNVLHAGDSPAAETYLVHLVRLNNSDFIDVTSKSQPDLGIAGHLFGKFSLQGDECRVTVFDDAWLRRTVQAGLAPQAVAVESSGQVILTAPTADLQRFVLLHAADPDAWDADVGTFHRVR